MGSSRNMTTTRETHLVRRAGPKQPVENDGQVDTHNIIPQQGIQR
jgi:hypothetical protein